MSSSTSSSEVAHAASVLPVRSFVAAFLLVGLALLGASEWLLRARVVPADMLTRHIAFFEASRARDVAFGDSHVARDFNPAPPVANLAYPSENIAHMRWKTQRYLARVPHPRRVLLQADPHLFAAYRMDKGLGDYPALFGGDYATQPYLMSDEYRPQIGPLWGSFVRNRGRMVSDVAFTPQGGLLSPGDLSRWGKRELAGWVTDRVRLQTPAPAFEHSQAARDYADIVSSFVAAGAQVCLVSFPLSRPYREGLARLDPASRSRWHAARDFYRGLARQPGVTWFDDTTQLDDADLFRDPDHLNEKGAHLYSPHLQHQCFGSDWPAS